MKKLLYFLAFWCVSASAQITTDTILAIATSPLTPQWRVGNNGGKATYWLSNPGVVGKSWVMYSGQQINNWFVPKTNTITINGSVQPLGGNPSFTIADVVIKVHQVYAMGNSLTANGVYCQRLDTLLGKQWYVVNKGIQGQESGDMLARFTTDITIHNDCEYVTILGGINDVIHSKTALSIEANLQAMYTAAHNAGIKVVGITLLPFKGNVNWTSGKQAVVDSVNTWIKTIATNVDYKVDAYAVFNDPSNPGQMLPAYLGTSPDYLHPNVAGYVFLGTTIYNNVTWTPNTTPVTLGISSDTYINQNLRTNDSVTFYNLALKAGQPSYGGGVVSGGNLYMPTTTATTGVIYNTGFPTISFPKLNNVLLGITTQSLSLITGNYQTRIGHEAGNNLTSSSNVTAIGAFSLFNATSGATEATAIGYQSGWSNKAVGGVFLGNRSGYYETGANKLFIDNTSRANEADARAKALIYGVFDPFVANQYLYVNASLLANTFISKAGMGVNFYDTDGTTQLGAIGKYSWAAGGSTDASIGIASNSGVKIAVNGSSTPILTIPSTGNIVSATSITAPSIKLTTGATNGYVLTSDASGNGTWAAAASPVTFAIRETPSGSINSSNTTYTLAHTPTAGTELVFRNGMLQVLSIDYTISGATITYLYAPTTGDVLRINYNY